MNKVSGCLDGVKWYRTSKQAARNAYNAGEEVLICAVNLNPFSVWRPGCIVANDGGRTFDRYDFEYRYLNCVDTETGKYAAFYVKVKGGK